MRARASSRASRSTEAPTAKLLSVYDGRRCAGFILARGKVAFEAFNADERSLGIFTTTREAAAAISAKETTT